MCSAQPHKGHSATRPRRVALRSPAVVGPIISLPNDSPAATRPAEYVSLVKAGLKTLKPPNDPIAPQGPGGAPWYYMRITLLLVQRNGSRSTQPDP